MKKLFTREAYNYALWGALFGLCFPIVATIIASVQSFGGVTLSDLLAGQARSPLLWIIDTAPFFLGLFAFFIGKEVNMVQEKSEEILKAQEQLILQEQMASIGQMTAGIVHEIKNPLNFVTNFAEGSLEIAEELQEVIEKHKNKFGEDDYDDLMVMITDLKQNATDIKNNGERANRIVHTLMDHRRGTEGDRRPVDINRLVDENVNLAFHSFRASHPSFNVDIQREYDESLGFVEVNPQSLGRVLLNILNNACYAVSQKQNEFSPTLWIKTSGQAGRLEICIRDNGPGIPEELRQKIFEPFFTTKSTGGGNTGLGLSISRDIIIQEHNGTLEVESESGKYTEFIIRLPQE